MRAAVVHVTDPFNPHNHRRVHEVRRRRRLRALAPRTRSPFICLVNGAPALRATWNRRVRDGDVVAFVALPQDGGGGGGSDPLRIVLMLAVIYFAPYAANALAGGTYLGMGVTGFQAASIALKIGGMMLVNALVPPPTPSAPGQAATAALAAPSPTYNLQAQGNTARIGSPIPVVYGRHLVYPDFGAQPYTEYAGNEQYLYQLLVVGQGEYTIEQIRIEDTIIQNGVVQDGAIHPATGSFQEIDYQVVAPGGSVTLFPANVGSSAEVSGQEAVYNTALGPFTANAAGTFANYLAVDVVCPRGLYFANTDGSLVQKTITFQVEARQIDDNGAPLGGWNTLANETLAAATTTPQRYSFKYYVTQGRYEVRLTRTSAKDTSTRAGNDLNWFGLRAYFPGTQQYGNITVLAMRLRATNQLTVQSSRKINCIVTRKLPVWNGTSWSAPQETRSIAWALADICRANYGLGLADARIGLAELLALDAVWAARGDYFDGVVDNATVAWDALTQAARAGRAAPYRQGGIVHFVRDAAQTLPVAMFTMRNIVRGSFKLEYLTPSEETADAVDVSYFDRAVWQPRTVRAALAGSAEQVVAKVQLTGVTERDQAWREGMYMAAANRYRRRLVTFSTEMEGFIPSRGDLIAVQHDMPKWGQGGEITAWDAGTLTATTSEPLDFSAGGNHYLVFRKRDGGVDGPYLVTAGAQANQCQLAAAPAIVPDVGGDRERTHYAFGPSSALYIRARMMSARPRGPHTAEISAVVESDYVHTADTGAAPGASAWQLPTRITVPVIADLTARSDPDTPDKMFLAWRPAPSADHYLVEASDSGQGWTRMGETRTANYAARAPYGARTVLRVCAVGATRGPWVEIGYSSSASYFWSGTDSNLMWNANPNTAMWRY
ncbi:MAG: phage tail protein [Pseudomonadota bacterium]